MSSASSTLDDFLEAQSRATRAFIDYQRGAMSDAAVRRLNDLEHAALMAHREAIARLEGEVTR